MPDGPLANRVAVVTGAGRGIGRAIAERFARDGAKVVLGDLDQERAAATARALGPDHLGVGGNLSSETASRAIVDQTISRFGQIDVLVNNAGGGILRPFLEHTPNTLRETIDRNLWSAVWMTWLSLPLMKAAGWGRIVNIGADSVRSGIAGHAAYNAAKGGMHAMTTALAREFAQDGITVNTIAPCAVWTEQYDEIETSAPELIERALAIIPMGRPGTVAEIASMAAYLAGPEAGFITGQTISVNGGSTMP
jgi:2,3-dihydroxy-2,3-dihydro-p-cumate dehydrogenase